jgi:acetyltransferase-like isoleucine patch superfamily enzyme
MAIPTIRSNGIVDVVFGEGVKINQPVNLYGCIIGDGTFIGPFVEVQKGVRIGKRCKIQSHSFVCELVTIGDDTVVAHGVMFINDMFKTGGPACGNKALWKATAIGNHVSIGSNATILPVRICDYVVIGAGSVVTKDITEPGIYAGNPARFLRHIKH